MDSCHRSGNRDSVAGRGGGSAAAAAEWVAACEWVVVVVVCVCGWEGGHLHTNWQSIDAIMTRMATPCQKPSCWLLGIAANAERHATT